MQGRRHNQTKLSGNPYGSVRIKELTYTVYGKAEEGKGEIRKTGTTTARAGPREAKQIAGMENEVNERFRRSSRRGGENSCRKGTQETRDRMVRGRGLTQPLPSGTRTQQPGAVKARRQRNVRGKSNN